MGSVCCKFWVGLTGFGLDLPRAIMVTQALCVVSHSLGLVDGTCPESGAVGRLSVHVSVGSGVIEPECSVFRPGPLAILSF